MSGLTYYNGYYHIGTHSLTIQGDEDGIMYYVSDGKYRKAKLQYKHPTGWGCSRFGSWFNARFSGGTSARVYLMDLIEYR